MHSMRAFTDQGELRVRFLDEISARIEVPWAAADERDAVRRTVGIFWGCARKRGRFSSGRLFRVWEEMMAAWSIMIPCGG
jgi:hypothetical protein